MNTYPNNYKVSSTQRQIEILNETFPKLKISNVMIPELHPKGEGLFIIPHWLQIAETYPEAVQKVLNALEKSRPFYNYRSGEIDADHLQQMPSKEAFWKSRPKESICLSAQFGMLHKGKSVENVRESTKTDELLLGAYEVGIMLLTNPKRLQAYEDLWIDCPGDMHAPGAGRVFSKAPIFYFYVGKLKFDTDDVSLVSDDYGSASGFLPQLASDIAPRKLESFGSLTLELSEIVLEIKGERYQLKKIN